MQLETQEIAEDLKKKEEEAHKKDIDMKEREYTVPARGGVDASRVGQAQGGRGCDFSLRSRERRTQVLKYSRREEALMEFRREQEEKREISLAVPSGPSLVTFL